MRLAAVKISEKRERTSRNVDRFEESVGGTVRRNRRITLPLAKNGSVVSLKYDRGDCQHALVVETDHVNRSGLVTASEVGDERVAPA